MSNDFSDIRIDGLFKHYVLDSKKIEVLKGVELAIKRGEKASIMGASGAGKSTFLHVLGTLDKPTAGMVTFGDVDVFKMGEGKLARFRNKTIGFVFQFHYLLPDFTALENVMIPGRIAREHPADSRARAEKILNEVGLGDRLNHKPGELSGGEQQRVAIARALVMEPAVLLADELTGNLDGSTAQGIHDLLHELNRIHRTTLIVVTHNRPLADSMDRRLILKDGRIIDRDLSDGEAE